MRIEFEQLDAEQTPIGKLTLHRYVAETGQQGYEIRVDDNFLMASHGARGERAMASLAHARLKAPDHWSRPSDGWTVLVGGLGAGHTVRAVLDLERVAAVVVVEISAKVVEWNRRYFFEANGRALNDPRVTLRIAQLGEELAREVERFDLLLLDVDNGPGWLASQANARLYEPAGVRDCLTALAPGGVLAVWSPEPNPLFRATLEQVFGEIEQISTELFARAEDGPADVVYLAQRSS